MLLPKNINLPAANLDNRPNSPSIWQKSQVAQQGVQNETVNAVTQSNQAQTAAIREAGLQRTEASATQKAASDLLNHKVIEIQTRQGLDPIKSKVELALMAQKDPNFLNLIL
tara:strand:- start:1820 stop:2155 length:336 start_codon:yes stop_codon:yes gene_type:complete